MEILLNEEVKTQVKMCVSKFTKDYMEEIAMVEVVKCIVNAESGEIIKKEFIQNRIFRNRIVPQGTSPENPQIQNSMVEQNDFDLLMSNISQMGEDAYFEKLLGIIVNEIAK